jgi:hypothetical protein
MYRRCDIVGLDNVLTRVNTPPDLNPDRAIPLPTP